MRQISQILLIVAMLLMAVAAWAQNPETAVFPGAIATDENLPVLKDYQLLPDTTLNGAISSGATTIVLTDASDWPEYSVLKIDSEFILVCDKTSNTFTVCTGGRGWSQSTAAAHSDGATVGVYDAAGHHNVQSAEIIAIETALGVNLANVAAATHATQHKHGGADEVATATPGANVIPKTGAGSTLAVGFLATGTPDGTKFVRDDGTLAVPPGSGGEVNDLEGDGADGIADTEIFVGTGAGTGNYVPISGDATLANTGALAVVNDSHAHTSSTISGLDVSADTNLAVSSPITLTDDTLGLEALGGDVTGTIGATVVGNDSHTHGSSTIAGLDISADTNLAVTAPVVLTDDTLSLSSAATLDTEWDTLAEVETVLSYDFSSASNLDTGTVNIARLPVGTANQLIKTNAGATSQEHATLAAEGGNEVSVTFGVGTITLDVVEANLDLASIGGTLGTGQADGGFILATEIDTFSELDAIVADEVLVNTNDVQTLESKVISGGIATTTHAAGANTVSVLRHATDCTAITDGVAGEVCWESDANRFFVCEPSAGGCDTAGEWTQDTDSTGAGGGIASVEEDNVEVVAAATVLDLLGADFDVTDAGSGEADVAIAAAISRDAESPAAGDVTGSLSAGYAVTDDSHAHTSSTLSGIDISADTNLAVTAPVVLTDDTLSLNQNAGTDITADLEEEAHATEHQNGGADEVATATPGANAIPKAEADGDINVGWIPLDAAYTWTGNHQHEPTSAVTGDLPTAGNFDAGWRLRPIPVTPAGTRYAGLVVGVDVDDGVLNKTHFGIVSDVRGGTTGTSGGVVGLWSNVANEVGGSSIVVNAANFYADNNQADDTLHAFKITGGTYLCDGTNKCSSAMNTFAGNSTWLEGIHLNGWNNYGLHVP